MRSCYLTRLPNPFQKSPLALGPDSRLWPALWLGALSLSACSVILDLGREQCEQDSDCPSATDGAVCEEGFCVSQSGGDDDDQGGSSDMTDEPECSKNEDCERDEFCDSGSCKVGCRDAQVCEIGLQCRAGECTGDPDPRWACLDTEDSGLLLAAPTHVSIPLEDVEGRRLTEASVELCHGYDTSCDSPLPLTVTEEGLIELELTLNADWYVTIVIPEFAPVVYMIPDWIREGDVLRPARIAPAELRQQLILATGNTLESSRGVVSMELFDCDGKEAGGVSFRSNRMDDKTVATYYPIGSDLTSTLDGVGAGGLLNHISGVAEVDLVLEETQQVLGGARANVWPGYTTLITLGIPPH